MTVKIELEINGTPVLVTPSIKIFLSLILKSGGNMPGFNVIPGDLLSLTISSEDGHVSLHEYVPELPRCCEED